MSAPAAMLGLLAEPRGLLVYPDGAEDHARTTLFGTLALFMRETAPDDEILMNLVVVDTVVGKKQLAKLLPGVETVTRDEAVHGALHHSQCIFIFAPGFFRTRFSERFAQATRLYGMVPKSHLRDVRGGMRDLRTIRMESA